MTTGSIAEKLRHLCQDIAQTDQRFEGIHFRPHDFRRLFATDLVNNGLPIHIGAALLGHLNLETTRGYVNYRELHQMGALPQVAWGVGEGNGPITSGRHAA